MVGMTQEKTGELTLAAVTRREVEKYAGYSDLAKLYPVLDDEHQSYAVVLIENERTKESVWVMMMAHIESDFVVIDEDTSLNKPLVEALTINGNIPREKIILAYKGETHP